MAAKETVEGGAGPGGGDASPPDGGARAWTIVLASFLCNGLAFGVINSGSFINDKLRSKYEASGMSEPALKASLVTSLCMGATFFLSPIAGILTDRIGIRLTTFIGGTLAAGGVFLSSFLTEQFYLLCLTYGIMFGVGASLTYTPSLAILGQYFKRNLDIVNGIVTAGSSAFTMLMSFLLPFLLSTFKLNGALRFIALMMCLFMVCSFAFKPNKAVIKKELSLSKELLYLVNRDIWKNKKYVIWLLLIAFSLLGYFVPYLHMASFIKKEFPDNRDDTKIVITCIGITSGVGRLIFGAIASLKWANRIVLQQISFFMIGVATIAMPFVPHFNWLIGMAFLFGLFDGCFISLLGPIAFDFCGQSGAAQAIGFLLGLCSVPLTLGPTVAGYLCDLNYSYTFIFIVAGIPPIIGSIALTLTRFVDSSNEEQTVPEQERLTKYKVTGDIVRNQNSEEALSP
ncbi:monocarboxylate transporter 10 isoform X1 [Bemisia tabaci]|uniref:monocarboxylate transporter 10 isoform X1 n=2 Tax=Bemisia tabaci TaxID=7038 RepID=UPI0008F98D65|nr:PREDICTED: monocarboxylate transporter 10 [Bemisia tabaci]XP_018916431.1 PREDICTED: monocarboxylate transporter 10 [Bemisia tabaci]